MFKIDEVTHFKAKIYDLIHSYHIKMYFIFINKYYNDLETTVIVSRIKHPSLPDPTD